MPQVMRQQDVVRSGLLRQLGEVNVLEAGLPSGVELAHPAALVGRVVSVVAAVQAGAIDREALDDVGQLARRTSHQRTQDGHRRDGIEARLRRGGGGHQHQARAHQVSEHGARVYRGLGDASRIQAAVALPLARGLRLGGYKGTGGSPMALPLALLLAASTLVQNPTTAAWTVKMKGPIRWQQVTPAGALLVSTDAGLAAVDMGRGGTVWEKPGLGGLPVDSVRMVEGSLLMEAARPGLLIVFDPVTGAVVFDSRRLSLVQVVTRRVLPQSGTLLVHGRRASGPPVVALYDLTTGAQRWASESLFQESGPKRGGLGGLMQGLVRAASGATALQVLQAGSDMIIVHTLMGLRGLDARTGAVRWSATLPTARAGNPARHVQLFPSLGKSDRIYVGFDDRLMAYAIADGRALWPQPATIDGWVHGIVEHPDGIIILPESPPANEATGNVRVINGVVQTGLNIARYADGTTIAAKPLRMRGTVTDALTAGGSAGLAADAEPRTFVNVLVVATATVRLKKDVKIKGQLPDPT